MHWIIIIFKGNNSTVVHFNLFTLQSRIYTKLLFFVYGSAVESQQSRKEFKNRITFEMDQKKKYKRNPDIWLFFPKNLKNLKLTTLILEAFKIQISLNLQAFFLALFSKFDFNYSTFCYKKLGSKKKWGLKIKTDSY